MAENVATPSVSANEGSTAASEADQIFSDGASFKPLVLGKLKDLESGRKYNILRVKRASSKKFPEFGEGIIAQIERDHDIVSVFMPRMYNNTMFKSVKEDHPVIMNGYKVAVHEMGRTHRVELFKP